MMNAVCTSHSIQHIVYAVLYLTAQIVPVFLHLTGKAASTARVGVVIKVNIVYLCRRADIFNTINKAIKHLCGVALLPRTCIYNSYLHSAHTSEALSASRLPRS